MASGNELLAGLWHRTWAGGQEEADAPRHELSGASAGTDDTLEALERDLAELTETVRQRKRDMDGLGTRNGRTGKGRGDNVPPGSVKRDAFGFELDNAQIGRENGVAEKDLAAFSERFGTELQQQLAKIPKSSIQSPESYRNSWNSAFLQAVKIASADAKRANAPKVDTASQTVKVEIALPNGQKASIVAASRQAADDFMSQLKRASRSAAA